MYLVFTEDVLSGGVYVPCIYRGCTSGGVYVPCIYRGCTFGGVYVPCKLYLQRIYIPLVEFTYLVFIENVPLAEFTLCTL